MAMLVSGMAAWKMMTPWTKACVFLEGWELHEVKKDGNDCINTHSFIEGPNIHPFEGEKLWMLKLFDSPRKLWRLSVRKISLVRRYTKLTLSTNFLCRFLSVLNRQRMEQLIINLFINCRSSKLTAKEMKAQFGSLELGFPARGLLVILIICDNKNLFYATSRWVREKKTLIIV